MKNRFAWAVVTSTAASASVLFGADDARACGGCFHPPTQSISDITDERMLLAVSPTQSTLYDQIQYAGSPSSFAWVLPIQGTVTVGLSADVLFDTFDVLTETKIEPPESSCTFCGPTGSSGSSSGGAYAAAADAGAAAVTVLKQENVGPYATVQLQSTDPNALANWLSQNGFGLPAAAAPVVSAYINEGFNFLAMKLLPNQGVQAMRPVRVTTQGASLSLPLRMASVGTGATVGITIWVVSDGRYEPQNFPFFHIDNSELVWDWSTSSSNYTALRSQNEAALQNAAWEIESSIDLNEMLISNVILSGGVYYGSNFTLPPSDPSIDYLPVGAGGTGDGGVGDGGASTGDGGAAAQARAEDINALFVGLSGPTVRVTRVRSDIAQAAMTKDLVFQASSDQSELSNVRVVTQSINENCPVISCGGSSGTRTGDSGVAGYSGSATSGGATSGSASSGSTAGATSATGMTGTAGAGASGSTAGAATSGTVVTPAPVDAGVANGANASAQSPGACATTAPGLAEGPAAVTGLAAMVGLALARTIRRRRKQD